MSRFLFATAGSLGDLHPYIAVSRALLRRGHSAVIATAEEYRADVERAGAEFRPVRPSFAEMGDYAALLARLFDPRRGPEYLVRELVMSNLRPAYEDSLKAATGVDLLISHPLTVTLPLIAQRLALPWVGTALTPMSLMSVADPPLFAFLPWLRKLRRMGAQPYRLVFGLIKRSMHSWEAPLREFRKQIGLPPSAKMALFEGQFSSLRNLALFDPQLAAPQVDWPENLRVCGAPVYDGPALQANVAAELDEFLLTGDAPIVFGLGSSAVWVAGDFWEKAIQAAQILGKRALLVTGPATLERLPCSVRAFAYVPYSKVFPHAAVVVHQAGIGTLAQAMRSTRPQLLVPMAFDQPDNAMRASALGVGRVIPFQKVTATRLAGELAMLLGVPEYGRRAREVAAALTPIDGAERAADELIACLRSDAGKPGASPPL